MKKRLNKCSNIENRISSQHENHLNQSQLRHNNLSENNSVENETSNSGFHDAITHIQRNNDLESAKIVKDESVTVNNLVDNPEVSITPI